MYLFHEAYCLRRRNIVDYKCTSCCHVIGSGTAASILLGRWPLQKPKLPTLASHVKRWRGNRVNCCCCCFQKYTLSVRKDLSPPRQPFAIQFQPQTPGCSEFWHAPLLRFHPRRLSFVLPSFLFPWQEHKTRTLLLGVHQENIPFETVKTNPFESGPNRVSYCFQFQRLLQSLPMSLPLVVLWDDQCVLFCVWRLPFDQLTIQTIQ